MILEFANYLKYSILIGVVDDDVNIELEHWRGSDDDSDEDP